jgi:hypothetical protein
MMPIFFIIVSDLLITDPWKLSFNFIGYLNLEGVSRSP